MADPMDRYSPAPRALYEAARALLATSRVNDHGFLTVGDPEERRLLDAANALNDEACEWRPEATEPPHDLSARIRALEPVDGA